MIEKKLSFRVEGVGRIEFLHNCFGSIGWLENLQASSCVSMEVSARPEIFESFPRLSGPLRDSDESLVLVLQINN